MGFENNKLKAGALIGRAVSSVLILALVTYLSIPLSADKIKANEARLYNLAAENRFRPTTNLELTNKIQLKEFVMNALKIDPGIVGQKVTLFSSVDGKIFEIFFAKPANIGNAYIIPCAIDEKRYYAYTYKRDGVWMQVEIATEDEYKEDSRKGRIPFEMIKELDKETTAGGFMAVIDTSDSAYINARGFFAAVGAKKMEGYLDERAKARALALYSAPYLATDEVVLSARYRDSERAREIMRYVLAKFGAPLSCMERFNAAFNKYLESVKAKADFRLEDIDPELNVVLRKAEGDMKNAASGEGLLKFTNAAYEKMIDISDVDIDDCADVKKDMVEILNKVALHEEEDLRRGSGSRKPVAIEKGSLVPEAIDVRPISKCLLPSMAASVENGKVRIALNENFLKLMHKYKPILEKMDVYARGNIVFPNYQKTYGNFYKAILYSFAIHELRGHVRVDDKGGIILNMSEIGAQMKRGRIHLYGNMVATLFYWFVIVEGSQDPGQRTAYFLREESDLFINLTEDERRGLPVHIDQLYEEFRSHFEKAPRVTTGTTFEKYEAEVREEMYNPALVFQTFWFDSNGKPMTIGDLNIFLRGSTYKNVESAVYLLAKLGIVEAVAPATPDIPISYRLTKMANAYGNDIREYFAEHYFEPKNIATANTDEGIKTARSKVAEAIEGWWPNEVLERLSEAEKRYKEGARIEDKRIVAIDIEWVPLSQRRYVDSMMMLLEAKMKRAGIEFLRRRPAEKKEDFARRIIRVQAAEKISAEKVAVIAEKDLAELAEMKALQAPVAGAKAAFFSIVNPEELTLESYVNVLDILLMTMRLAFDEDKTVASDYYVKVVQMAYRMVMMVPRARPIDGQSIVNIYKNLITILESA